MRWGKGLSCVSCLHSCPSSASSNNLPPPPPPAPPPAPNSVFVAVSNFQFPPDTVKITVGTPVRWTNEGSVSHSVTSDSTGSFNSGTLSNGGVDQYGMPYAGSTYDLTFATAGTYPYHCSFHRQMKGVVIGSD